MFKFYNRLLYTVFSRDLTVLKVVGIRFNSPQYLFPVQCEQPPGSAAHVQSHRAVVENLQNNDDQIQQKQNSDR